MSGRMFVSLVILAVLQFTDGTMRCMKCSSTPLPHLCETVETCSGNEVGPYTSRTNLYSSCLRPSKVEGEDTMYCPLIVSLSSTFNGANTKTCLLCREGTGLWTHFVQQRMYFYIDIPVDHRGPHCFTGNYAVDVGQTNHVTTCSSSEVCTITPVTFPGSTDVFYSQKCTPKSTCVETHTNTGCDGSCCVADFCNDRCVHYTTPSPTVSYGDVLRTECLKHINDGYFYDSTSNLCVHIVKSHGLFTRPQAEQKCRAEGGDLMTITNENEQYFLLTWIFSHRANDTDFWIGAKANVSKSHVYYWPDGSPVSGYNHWSGLMMGQPDDRRTKDENCVFLNDKDRYFWHDDVCAAKKTGYICEIWNVTSDKVSICRRHLFDGFFYDSDNDICVLFRESRIPQFTHSAAEVQCNKFGASLVNLDSAKKMDFALKWIFSNHENATDFWIGAKDIHNNTEFYWPNGKKLSYSHWGGPVFPPEPHGQPDVLYGVTNEHCVYMDPTHKYYWFDEVCSAKKNGFICQYFGAGINATRTECRNRLTQGYFYDEYTHMCVKIVTNNLSSQARARQLCLAENADLVVVDSEDKMDFLLMWIFYLKANDTDFWIGGKDLHGTNNFVWLNGGQKFSYTHWYTIIPPKPKDCAILDHIDIYRWKTTACDSNKHGYICQINQRTIDCNKLKADIVYVLDSSGSEGLSHFNSMKNIVSNVTHQLFQDPTDIRFAAIKFSSTASQEFRLDSYLKEDQVLAAIKNITYDSGTSHIGEAFKIARVKSFTEQEGSRPNSVKILIIFSDGGSNNPAATKVEAGLLKNVADVIAVGFGPQSSIRTAELAEFSSNNAVVRPDMNEIYKAVQGILKTASGSQC